VPVGSHLSVLDHHIEFGDFGHAQFAQAARRRLYGIRGGILQE
jgi:hypothetical protein